ncbi:hypothetical protein ERS043892_02691, partial [Streptococcus pneumoniae]
MAYLLRWQQLRAMLVKTVSDRKPYSAILVRKARDKRQQSVSWSIVISLV